MSLRSRHKNWNWSLNRKIEVATKLRVEEQKGRSQPETKPNRSPCQETEVETIY